MLHIVIVDDEIAAVEMLESILSKMEEPDKMQITTFHRPLKAAEYLESHKPDILFLDIEMPVLSGIELAGKVLSSYDDPPEIIFVTAYPQYAMDAWKLEVTDYVLKPYDAGQIGKAVTRAKYYMMAKRQMESEKTIINCFPEFNVFVDNQPIHFASKRAKELLAFLVHHRGGWVSLDKITYELLEEAPEKDAKNHIRMILTRLRRTLISYGLENMIESRRGELRVNTDCFACDYYRFLAGEKELFTGSYMGDYSWAEEETAYLYKMKGIV